MKKFSILNNLQVLPMVNGLLVANTIISRKDNGLIKNGCLKLEYVLKVLCKNNSDSDGLWITAG